MKKLFVHETLTMMCRFFVAALSFSVLTPLIVGNELHLVNFYFKNVKPVKDIAVYACNENVTLTKSLTKNGFKISVNSMPPPPTQPIGIYVDLNCSSLETLHKGIFNLSYFWLIRGRDSAVMDHVFQINIDSQITFADDSGKLFDIYSYGRHLRRDLVRIVIGTWSQAAVKVEKRFSLLYRRDYRGNLNGTALRQGVPVSRLKSKFSYH